MGKSSVGKTNHLRRLDRECYQGQAYVHWTMAIENRATGWLIPIFYYKFRELMADTMFRYAITCPIFCLMPDHMHLLWVGIDDASDQLNASRYLRSRIKEPLAKLDFSLQHQPYDHVLTEDERQESSFIEIADYIARNPERKGLVRENAYRSYKYTSCMVPGYPELSPWMPDYWERFWRSYSFLRQNDLFRGRGESA